MVPACVRGRTLIANTGTPVESTVYDSFTGAGAIDSNKWNTYQAAEPAISVAQANNRYEGTVSGAGATDTTWFQGDEGRMDYVTFNGDFDFIARNIGLRSGSTVNEFQFCGIIGWLSANNWEFAVAGNRGTIASNTCEYKVTITSTSNQNDIGNNAITNDRCDLRVTRSGSTVTFYYQQAGTSPDSWTSFDHDGLAGGRVSFGTGDMRVGLITYGYDTPVDFVGSCDQVEIPSGTPVVS